MSPRKPCHCLHFYSSSCSGRLASSSPSPFTWPLTPAVHFSPTSGCNAPRSGCHHPCDAGQCPPFRAATTTRSRTLGKRLVSPTPWKLGGGKGTVVSGLQSPQLGRGCRSPQGVVGSECGRRSLGGSRQEGLGEGLGPGTSSRRVAVCLGLVG